MFNVETFNLKGTFAWGYLNSVFQGLTYFDDNIHAALLFQEAPPR